VAKKDPAVPDTTFKAIMLYDRGYAEVIFTKGAIGAAYGMNFQTVREACTNAAALETLYTEMTRRKRKFVVSINRAATYMSVSLRVGKLYGLHTHATDEAVETLEELKLAVEQRIITFTLGGDF
jgi:hypothetical protein